MAWIVVDYFGSTFQTDGRAVVDLTGKLLAISTAMHQGTKEHQALVLKVLDSVGLSEDELQCWPLGL
jgi:L-asparaginase II